jgi:hypothetical protein
MVTVTTDHMTWLNNGVITIVIKMILIFEGELNKYIFCTKLYTLSI